jgi:hypothetical protein
MTGRCIDQKDIPEKTHQVQLMGEIYKNCDECLVYLGDELEDIASSMAPPPVLSFGDGTQPLLEDQTDECRKPSIRRIFSFLQELGQLETHGNGENLSELSVFQKTTSNEDNTASLEVFEALERFLNPRFTPWWSRIWVVQEITLPGRVVLIHGTISASWSMFERAASEYIIHSRPSCAAVIASLPYDRMNVILDPCSRILAIKHLRIAQYRTVDKDQIGYSRSLLTLLRTFRDRNASDPRDKVYALLGLVQERVSMIPDYSLGDVEVYRQATLESIYNSKDLSVFSTELGQKSRSDLPSWIPDWSAPGEQTYSGRAEAVKLYNACPDPATPTVVVPGENLALCLQTLQAAPVDYVGEVMWREDTCYNMETLHKWWTFLLMRQEGHRKSMVRHAEGDMPVNNALHTFCKLICAEVTTWIRGADIDRTGAHDELRFITWSTRSTLSPFRGTNNPYNDGLCSEDASMWRDVLVLWPNEPVLMLDAEVVERPRDYWFPERLADNSGEVSQLVERILKHLRASRTLLDDTTWERTFNESGELRRDAPWKYLLQNIRERLLTVYGNKAYRNFEPMWRDDTISVIDNFIMTATLSRRLICGNHFVGLGPADTQIGDEVHVLVGGKTPFLLRPRDKQDKAPEPKYEILGDCYVQGWMDGDAEEMASFERKTILLV